uniref:NET domain-containing protein n=1 Tax=viral metagenome TaxID=1070528 RepID=A0A6C0CN36_9ZZZZ
MNLNRMLTQEILEEIHHLDSSNHIVIGTILRKYPKVKLNENKNGIMVNISTLPEEALEEILDYMKYLKEQQCVLNEREEQTNEYKKLITELNKIEIA